MQLNERQYESLEAYMEARAARWNKPLIQCCECGKIIPTKDANGDLGGNPLCEPCVDKVLAECRADLAAMGCW